MIPCPETSALKQFSLGTLQGSRYDEILSHVDGCAGCERRLAELENQKDDLVSALQSIPIDAVDPHEESTIRLTDVILGNLTSSPKSQVSFDAGRRLAQQLDRGQCRLERFELLEEVGPVSVEPLNVEIRKAPDVGPLPDRPKPPHQT